MPQNDPSIVFSLEPLNPEACDDLTASQNAHLRAILPDGSTHVLSIGKFAGGESKYTLATIGRGTDANGCTFDIHENSKEIMLRDWSTQKTTQVSRKNPMAIEGRGGIRHVVLDDAKPLDFGFGGPDCNVYQFRLHWHMKSAEVIFLSRASHENVVEFKGYQQDATFAEIFTELMSGTVDNLRIQNFYSDHSPRVDTIPYTGPNTHVNSLLHQTLKGLDYLATQKIVHLDIKPENILYSLSPEGEYVYKLADFGTAHAVGTGGDVGGVGCIGTEMYRAPELSQEGAKAKTENDIWSLFVTMAVAMDTGGFRRKALYMTALRVIAVQEAADHPSMAMMSSMAKADPDERATAEEMLIKLFNGEGCAPRPKPQTPSNRVQKRKALSGALKTTAESQRREPYQTRQARRRPQQSAPSERQEMREMVREAQRHNDEMDWEQTVSEVQKEWD